jgi:1-deoxy-D-xylulose-5-phosphate synthase
LLRFARRVEEHAKGMVTPATLFEELGFNYIGPIDGHDLDALIPTLENLRALSGPQFLHIVTQKGHGYERAEQDPITYHGPGRFDPKVGIKAKAPGQPTFTQIFGRWLCDAASADDSVVGITPAMCEGSGLNEFAERFPQRYFDVGIAEQHAVTFAAGLACEGLKPVLAIYSTFLQRGYDQVIHDVAIQNLPLLLAIDRAGVVGADGATHMGAFDIAYLRCIPNMVVMTPSDEAECRLMLQTGLLCGRPAAVRYPRGTGVGAQVPATLHTLPLGKAKWLRQTQAAPGKRLALLVFGSLLPAAATVAQKLDASLVDMRFVKPLDEALLIQIAQQHEALVTVEDGCIKGGAGSAVGEFLQTQDLLRPTLQLGYPDAFIEHGAPEALHSQLGLDAQGIEATIRARLGQWLR